MVDSYKEYKRYIETEKPLYLANRSIIDILVMVFTHDGTYLTWKLLKSLRKCEFLKNTSRGGIKSILLAVERRRKNKLGLLMGFEIYENCFEEGLLLYHRNVIVNSACRCGKNVRFHGMNCIGNKGNSSECPMIGDNVEFGFGSSAFGEVSIPSNCVIAANATVINSLENNVMMAAGTPAVEKKWK